MIELSLNENGSQFLEKKNHYFEDENCQIFLANFEGRDFEIALSIIF